MCNTPYQGTLDTLVSTGPRETGGSRTLGITRLRRAVRRFRRGQRGTAAIESALGIAVLVISLAGLMEIVNTVYASDEMSRAARAAARALALDPQADACAAIRRELRLAEDFDCETELAPRVNHGVGPLELPETLDEDPQIGTGDLVLVRIFPGGSPLPLGVGLARCE